MEKGGLMKYATMLAISISVFLQSSMARSFEVLAFGTSAINCAGVDREKAFTVRLQEFLRRDGVNAEVVGAGLNGDRPQYMLGRLAELATTSIKLVIFEPGPNEPNKELAISGIEQVLGYLKQHSIPTIYVSTGATQTVEEAEATARKFGAVYYGHWRRDVPMDNEHFQFDFRNGGKGQGGHMTALGCEKWAQNISPLVKSVAKQKHLK